MGRGLAEEYAFEMTPAGKTWFSLGPDILIKHFGLPQDVELARYITSQVYHAVIAAIDSHARRVPLIDGTARLPVLTLMHFLNEMEDTADAINFAYTALESYIKKVVTKEMTLYQDAHMLVTAFHKSLTETEGILILDEESKAVNTFLRRHDPMQIIKFVVMPTQDHWVVLTVDYNHQPYNTYVPIVHNNDPDVKWVDRRRFKATAKTKEAAIWLAEHSLETYYNWWNMPRRLLRAISQLTRRNGHGAN